MKLNLFGYLFYEKSFNTSVYSYELHKVPVCEGVLVLFWTEKLFPRQNNLLMTDVQKVQKEVLKICLRD